MVQGLYRLSPNPVKIIFQPTDDIVVEALIPISVHSYGLALFTPEFTKTWSLCWILYQSSPRNGDSLFDENFCTYNSIIHRVTKVLLEKHINLGIEALWNIGIKFSKWFRI